MSQATELIARQMAAGASIGKIWGNLIFNVKDSAYGAIGNGVKDDTAAINAAIAAMPSTGGVLWFPAGGTYGISAPMLLNKSMMVIMYGATIKPLVDTDIFRTTGLFVTIDGGVIDGINLPAGAGVGCGVTVGYGGFNSMQNRISNLHIKNMKGHGVKWEHGPFLNVDNVIVQDCGGDGFLFTENYDDNNHGIINAHAINCAGAGYRVKDNAAVPNNSSRSHHFIYAKAFGCTGGGFVIETSGNAGLFFLELNGGTQAVFTATSKGNNINILGVPAAYAALSDLGGANMIYGSNAFDQATYKKLQTEVTRIRNTVNVGALELKPIADNVFQMIPTDTGGNVELQFSKGGAGSFIQRFEDARFGSSGSPIYSEIVYSKVLAFPSIAAQSTSLININVAGVLTTDMVYVTPVANLEDGLIVQGAIAADGIIQIKMHNYTIAAKTPASRNFIISVRRTNPTVL